MNAAGRAYSVSTRRGKRVGVLRLRRAFAMRSRASARDASFTGGIRPSRKVSPPSTGLPDRRGKSAGPHAVSNARGLSATYRDAHALALPRTSLPAFPQSRGMELPVPQEL